MSQPEISPLARRLAEENNVDWRGLHGSGAGGKVVERDVLEFLARVMAGEEDLDPTPEPVPEGMEAWPDDDVRSFQQEVQASRRDAGLDEIQQELSASDRMGDDARPGPAFEGLEESAGPAEAEEISEDIFLFEDDSGEDQPDLEPWDRDAHRMEGYSAEPASQGAEDDLLVAGEDDGLEADAAAPTGHGLDDEGLGAHAGAGASDEALFGGEAAGAGDGQPSEPPATSGTTEEARDLPDVFGNASWQEREPWTGASDDALFGRQAGAGGRGPSGGDADGLEVPPLGEVEAGGGGASTGAAAGAGSGWDSAPEEPWEPAPSDADRDNAGAPWDVAAGPTDGAPSGGGERAMPAAGEGFDGDAFGTAPDESGAGGVEPGAPEPDIADAGIARPDRREPFERGSAAAGAVGEAVSGGAMDAEPAAVPSELPLVSYGSLLRRHLDVTALAGAQLAVGLELGEGEPLSAAPFLLRAAAKAAAEGGWGDGSVATVAFEGDGGVQLRRIDDAARRPFLELVQALAEGGAPEGQTAALSVVDMSALDVDEAVLDVGGPQLTLGRILYDNQRGSYRSTLSLAGEVPAERGAKLLARVAELLDAPVRLML